MIKKSVTYIDFDGNEVKEDLYFNLNVVEQTKFEARYITEKYPTLEAFLKSLVDHPDAKVSIDFICDLIESSYGIKYDGKIFKKNKEIREEFENSLAYAELFEELLEDPKKLESFATGILKKNETKQVASSNVIQ